MRSREQYTKTTTSPVCHSRQLALTGPPDHGSDVPWTAARCQRLLRPLSLKIALLRKLRSAGAQQESADGGLYGERKAGVTTNSGERDQQVQFIQSGCTEKEEWDCSPRPRKRIKRTYSSRTRTQVAGLDQGGRKTEPEAAWSGASTQTLICQLSMPSITREPETSDVGPHEGKKRRTSLVDILRPVPKHLKRARSQPGTLATSDPSRLHIQYLTQGESKELFKLCDGIYTSLSTLLKATQSMHNANRRGCRSLLSICLKTVPDYILEEDYWAKVENPDDKSDMTPIVYSELESTVVGIGWQPLRNIVRAHGITLVRTAITESLIPFNVAKVLVDLCIAQGAEDEAEMILESVTSLSLSRERRIAETEIFNEQRSLLNTVRLFSETTGKHGVIYMHLTAMMESELPTTIFGSSLYTSISRAIQSVTLGDDGAKGAATLIRTLVRHSYITLIPAMSLQTQNIRLASRSIRRRVILRSAASKEKNVRGCAKPRLNLGQVVYAAELCAKFAPVDLANLLALLSAVGIFLQENPQEDPTIAQNPMAILIREMAFEAHQSLEIVSNTVGGPGTVLNHRTLTLPLLADVLVTTLSDETAFKDSLAISPDLGTLSGISFEENFVNEAASFMCMMAQYYSQVTSSNGFEFMKRAVDKLRTAAKSVAWSTSTQSFLNRLGMAAAFSFSKDSSQPTHLDWALNVEQAICIGNNTTPRRFLERTPARAALQARNGYKWEEGICEWIAKTPAMKLCRLTDAHLSGESNDDDSKTQATSTPRTSPEPDWGPAAPFSPCLTSKKRAGITVPTYNHDYASMQCVRIMVTRPEISTKQRPPISKRLSQGGEAKYRDLLEFQSYGGYDDADELCPAQELRMLSLPGLRERSPTACTGASSKEIGGGKATRLEKQNPKRRLIGIINSDNENSDTEDELSFT
ncbi:MAG: hypothetical protein Q9217_003636 [Psora testacea]